MFNQSIRLLTVGLAIAVATADASDFPALVAKVPRGSNSLVLIDVDAVLASPIAQSNGWARRFNDGNSDRPLYLPPEADKVAIAVQLDLVRGCAKNWEVAVMGMKEPFSMSLIARAEGGYVDEIEGVKAAWVPSDAYFIELDPQTLGLMAPADRQSIARWAEKGKTAQPEMLSDYLGALTTSAGHGAQVVMAIDAADAIQPHRVRARLEGSKFATSQNLDSTIELISSLRGLVFQLTFNTKVQAVARIDFAVPVLLKEDVAKGLVLGAMENLQFSLPGTENWSCSVKENSIIMSGELDNDALRRVFTLMELPTTKFSSLKDQSIEDNSQATVVKCSQAYFHAVDAMLIDLKKRTKVNSAGDAGWIDRYAAKIDRLPVPHVDEELLTYGEKLTETLRIISGSRKMSNMQGASAERVAIGEAGVSSSNDGYGYRAYSYTSPRVAETNAGNIRADATATGTSVKLQGWTLIDNATLAIRKVMTQKYNMEF